MVPNGDLYLPGTVRESTDGVQFEYDGDEVPMEGVEKLAGMDGESCTVGLAVDIGTVEPAADDESLGLERKGGHVQLIGESYRTGYFFGRSQQAHYHNFTLSPGLWPSGDGGLRTWAEPLDNHREADRLRVTVDSLTVVEVLTGADDPYAERVPDLRFEFKPDEKAFRLFVGATQLWPQDGWYEVNGNNSCTELALGMLGSWLRETLDGSDAEGTSHHMYHTGIEVDGDRDLARVQVGSTDRAIGPWPRDGVRIETDDLVRAWTRDTQWYLSTRENEQLESVLEDVRELAPELTADIESEQPLAEPETVPRARLYELVASDDDLGRDALSVLQDRTDAENVAEVGAFLVESDLPEERARVLVKRVGNVGGVDAVRQLLRFAEQRPERTLRAETVERIRRSSPPTVAAAVVLETFDSDVDPMLATLGEAVDDDPDWVPAGVDPTGVGMDRLLTELEGCEAAWRREILAYAMGGITPRATEPWVEALLDAMVTEPDSDVREQLCETVESWEDAGTKAFGAHALTASDDRQQRSVLRAAIESGEPPAFLREWLYDDDDYDRRAAAARAAPAFTEDPPYEALVDCLIECREGIGRRTMDGRLAARDALETLAGDESAALPPVETMLRLCDQSVEARNVAVEALLRAAASHDGGDFFGVDPERLHRTVFETQQGNAKRDTKRLGALVGETLDEFDPDTLQALPTANLRRAVVMRTVYHVGVEAEPLVRTVRAGADAKMADLCDRLLEKIEAAKEEENG